MKETLNKIIKTTFAIAAFGIGAANIVNGTMIMYDMYRDNFPRDYTLRFLTPETNETGADGGGAAE